MYTPQFAATKDEIYGYGLGIGAEIWKGITILQHGGGGYGYNSYLSWLPEYQIGVVVLANAIRLTDNLPWEISDKALAMMTQAKHGPALTDKPLARSGGPIVSLQAEQLRRLEGTYSHRSGSVVTFKVEEGSLFYIQGGSKVKLNAHSATEFTSNIQTFNFHLDRAGKVTGVLVQGWRSVGIFALMNDHPDDPPGPNRPEWQSYVGALYRTKNAAELWS
jgi:hypothetical protein